MGNCPVSLNLHRRGAGHKRIHDRNVRAGRRVVSVENGVYTNRKAISVRPLISDPQPLGRVLVTVRGSNRSTSLKDQ
ncbi:hypothetical protein TNCV_986971 [Trichonephila clavipes]|nr:hypothetical protein TNCV_986971 [Trichonephila clavipes]